MEQFQNSYIPFMENFLVTLYKCYKELDKRFPLSTENALKNERITQTLLNSVLPISKAEICDILPDISVTTVEAVLGKMVKYGSIKKLGQIKKSKTLSVPSPSKGELCTET